MKVLDITLIEIVPGDLRLEEDVPLLGQAQTALLLVRVVAVPPCLDGPGDSVKDARPLQAPYICWLRMVPLASSCSMCSMLKVWLLLSGRHLFLVYYAWGQTVPLLIIRVKQRAGSRAGEAVAVFPHDVDHIRSHAAQHLLVVLCKTTGGKCGS